MMTTEGRVSQFKEIEKIPLQQIDLSDETFSVNFLPDLDRLRSSIKSIGLIQPVLLRSRGDRFQIISGFRRLWTIRDLGGEAIDARISDQGTGDDLGLFLISLHENLTGRGFNAVETAMALSALVFHFGVSRSDVIKIFFPLFSLETNEKILNTYLSLAVMEEEVRRYVVHEKVSRSNIRRLSSLTPEDRMGVLSLVSLLNLGENSLREVLTLLEEISRRDQVRIGEIANRPEIRTILAHKEFTSPQRTERIKRILMDLRYPRMSRLEQEFVDKRKALNLPPGLSIHHQPYFEGKGLKMEVRFETLEEYQRLVKDLLRFSDKKEFEELVKEK